MKQQDSFAASPARIAPVNGQKVRFEQLVQFPGMNKVIAGKLRVIIESDSYREQCRAALDRWDGAQWHNVVELTSHEMKTETGLAYLPAERKATAKSFELDRQELLDRAKLVLF